MVFYLLIRTMHMCTHPPTHTKASGEESVKSGKLIKVLVSDGEYYKRSEVEKSVFA